jgi:hypothetical protein
VCITFAGFRNLCFVGRHTLLLGLYGLLSSIRCKETVAGMKDDGDYVAG